ncbi:MAG: hypothetical protein D6835_02285 [Candidatus Thermofonsia bacterium]|nr:MAG: hypothetical protein D6835_02285 [Candidatus Thermofonsia bacterium]
MIQKRFMVEGNKVRDWGLAHTKNLYVWDNAQFLNLPRCPLNQNQNKTGASCVRPCFISI